MNVHCRVWGSCGPENTGEAKEKKLLVALEPVFGGFRDVTVPLQETAVGGVAAGLPLPRAVGPAHAFLPGQPITRRRNTQTHGDNPDPSGPEQRRKKNVGFLGEKVDVKTAQGAILSQFENYPM